MGIIYVTNGLPTQVRLDRMSYIHVYSICYEPFLFRKPLVKNTFFKSFPKKDAQIVNLKNLLIRVWILRIHDPFLDLPCKKNAIFVFGFENLDLDYPQKNAPSKILI